MTEQPEHFGTWMEHEVKTIGVTWKDLSSETGLSIAGLRRIRVGEVDPRGATKKQVRAALRKFQAKKDQNHNFDLYWDHDGATWAVEPKTTRATEPAQAPDVGATLNVTVDGALAEAHHLNAASLERVERTLQLVAELLIAAETEAQRAATAGAHP